MTMKTLNTRTQNMKELWPRAAVGDGGLALPCRGSFGDDSNGVSLGLNRGLGVLDSQGRRGYAGCYVDAWNE